MSNVLLFLILFNANKKLLFLFIAHENVILKKKIIIKSQSVIKVVIKFLAFFAMRERLISLIRL